jgi:hypothetical protein
MGKIRMMGGAANKRRTRDAMRNREDATNDEHERCGRCVTAESDEIQRMRGASLCEKE